VQSFSEWYYWRSFRLFCALQKVTKQVEIDFVEFNDFYGPAYYSLVAKACGLAFSRTCLGVRLHNPWEILLTAGDGIAISSYVLAIRYLERAALRLAEHILSPSDDYTQHVYFPLYGKGLGDIHSSKPALLTWPQEVVHVSDNNNLIMFYGRLQPFKGPDRLLAACLELIHRIPGVEFWFVGADSTLSRDAGTISYRELLQQRIPDHLKPMFIFAGRLSFEELGEILPRVRFAVFPNYLESFCYAAHELYQARVPVITSNIPALAGSFLHQKNALMFDGSISDLVWQMEQLYHDHDLRNQLIRPYSTNQEPLGTFYDSLPTASWMSHQREPDEGCGILVVIIHDGAGNLDITLNSICPELGPTDTIVILHEIRAAQIAIPLLFLDRCYTPQSVAGDVLTPTEVTTKHALLIVEAGDQLQPDALGRWRDILIGHPQVSFVSAWQRRQLDSGERVDCFPIEICLDQLLFMARPLRQRVLMRTQVGLRMDDLFDLRLGPLGELGYLWHLDQHYGPGLSIPDVLINCRAEQHVIPSQEFAAAVAYLVAQDTSPSRQKSLALRSLQPEAAAGKLAAELRSIKGSKAWRLVANYRKMRSRLRAFRATLSL
jgi:glycosyltransferase involved in cell wall biosynthesis